MDFRRCGLQRLSYVFRPGRRESQTLDALTVGLEAERLNVAAGLHRKRVNWALDADIHGPLDTASYCFLIHESCSNNVQPLIDQFDSQAFAAALSHQHSLGLAALRCCITGCRKASSFIVVAICVR
jgi:hypothetical protein